MSRYVEVWRRMALEATQAHKLAQSQANKSLGLRDMAIRMLHRQGEPMIRIARHAGLTLEEVHEIINRED